MAGSADCHPTQIPSFVLQQAANNLRALNLSGNHLTELPEVEADPDVVPNLKRAGHLQP